MVFYLLQYVSSFCVFHDETEALGLKVQKGLFVLDYVIMTKISTGQITQIKLKRPDPLQFWSLF